MASESNYNIPREIPDTASLYTFDNGPKRRSNEKAKSSKTENNKEASSSSTKEKKSSSNKRRPTKKVHTFNNSSLQP
ncbi:hypothetical protein TB2_040078 [Malus domestica]